MPDSKLHVVGDWICTTDFELDPDTPTCFDIFEQHVGARRKAKDVFKFFRKNGNFVTTTPSAWGLSGEGTLQK